MIWILFSVIFCCLIKEKLHSTNRRSNWIWSRWRINLLVREFLNIEHIYSILSQFYFHFCFFFYIIVKNGLRRPGQIFWNGTIAKDKAQKIGRRFNDKQRPKHARISSEYFSLDIWYLNYIFQLDWFQIEYIFFKVLDHIKQRARLFGWQAYGVWRNSQRIRCVGEVQRVALRSARSSISGYKVD